METKTEKVEMTPDMKKFVRGAAKRCRSASSGV